MTAQSAHVVEAPHAVALEATGIVKSFEGVHALNGAHLAVRPGEIHALLGENGAGKSTLIKVLTGLYAPDDGEIFRSGRPLTLSGIRSAHAEGIVALYQELSIVPTISVAENIVLGEHMPSTGGIINWSEVERRAQAQLDRLNQHVPLRRLAGLLSPVQQTMVSLARALATNAEVLILDEPTASLTDTEIVEMFTVLRSLREQGVAIVYVSHRLEEVFELCDRLTIMRGGEHIITKDVADSTIDEVISRMVGREQGDLFPARGTATDEPVLQVTGLTGPRISDISFTAHAGEVLGIGGLAGSGRSEVMRILSGAQKPRDGSIAVLSHEVKHGVGRALAAGIALVPEERRSQGVDLDATIQDNIALANLHQVSRGSWVSGRRIASLAQRGLEQLQVRSRGPRQPVGQLSGGNQQKIVLAKMLARKPRVLLMDEPTRGIDVGTKAEIYRLMRELAAAGTAVIAVSSELPELIGMSDRIIIMHEGRISGEVSAAEATDELLLTYCYGRGL